MTGRTLATLDGIWHAGLGGAVYATGIGAALLQLSGVWWRHDATFLAAALLGVLCAAWGMMIADRAKWRDDQLDPADEAAWPRRFRFVRAHRGKLRKASVALLIIGGVLATLTGGLIGGVCVLAGGVSIFVYSGRPAGRPSVLGRLKDITLAKNVFVGGGLVTLGAGVCLGRSGSLGAWAPHASLLLALAVIVTGDAMLCDLPDIEADRAFGVRTLPVTWGRPAGALLATLLVAGGSVWATLQAESGRVGLLWLAGIVGGALLAQSLGDRWLKGVIDARPLLPAILVGASILS